MFELTDTTAMVYETVIPKRRELPHRLIGSEMYAHPVPVLLKDGLAFELVDRKWSQLEKRNGAEPTDRDSFEGLMAWFINVLEWVMKEYSPVE